MLVLKWVLAALSLTLAAHASAQKTPAPKVIRIIVPYTAGATSDLMARALAPGLAARLGVPVVVENRTGAGGMIGAASVVNGPHDGSALVVATSSLVTVAATSRNVPFDLNRDLTPVAMLGEGPLVIAVNAKSRIKTPTDLVEVARAQPGGLTAGSGGVGTLSHLVVELLASGVQAKIRHVPYRGVSQAVVDLSGGAIDMMIATKATFAPAVSAGFVRIIAVTTELPSPALPATPAINIAVPGFDVTVWFGMWAPTGTPAGLIERLNKELNELTRSPEFVTLLDADGNLPSTKTSVEVARRVRADFDTWKRVVTDKNIVVE